MNVRFFNAEYRVFLYGKNVGFSAEISNEESSSAEMSSAETSQDELNN